MNDLDSLYIQILKHGLIFIRNAAFNGDFELCLHESEHLHEIPSMIGKGGARSHRYYFDKMRGAFLEWVSQSQNPLGLHLARIHQDAWEKMEPLIAELGNEEN